MGKTSENKTKFTEKKRTELLPRQNDPEKQNCSEVEESEQNKTSVNLEQTKCEPEINKKTEKSQQDLQEHISKNISENILEKSSVNSKNNSGNNSENEISVKRENSNESIAEFSDHSAV